MFRQATDSCDARPGRADRLANGGDRVPVLRPGLLIRTLRGRTILAVADRVHARGGDALGLQVRSRGVGAAIAESEVVLFGATLVAVAGDLHVDAAVLSEPGGLLVQRAGGVTAQGGRIEVVENAIADIGNQIFLATRND